MILAVNSSNFGLDLLEVVGKHDKHLLQMVVFQGELTIVESVTKKQKDLPQKSGGLSAVIKLAILRDETM